MADKYLDDYIRCRMYGHAWEEQGLTRPYSGANSLALRCTRCTTTRYDLVHTATGELDGRSYVYTKGYQRTKDDPLPARNDLRLALLRRLRKRDA